MASLRVGMALPYLRQGISVCGVDELEEPLRLLAEMFERRIVGQRTRTRHNTSSPAPRSGLVAGGPQHQARKRLAATVVDDGWAGPVRDWMRPGGRQNQYRSSLLGAASRDASLLLHQLNAPISAARPSSVSFG